MMWDILFSPFLFSCARSGVVTCLPEVKIATIAMTDTLRVHSSDGNEVFEKIRVLTYCQYADANSS